MVSTTQIQALPQEKSSRHSKLTGEFGESLVLYWLSKRGFECARVDHTGMDIIANNPHNTQVMGISVKTRSRTRPDRSDSHVLFRSDDVTKLMIACQAFGCEPYFAFVVDADAAGEIDVFIAPLERVQTYGRTWKMRKVWTERYAADPEIKRFSLTSDTPRWW